MYLSRAIQKSTVVLHPCSKKAQKMLYAEYFLHVFNTLCCLLKNSVFPDIVLDILVISHIFKNVRLSYMNKYAVLFQVFICMQSSLFVCEAIIV